MKKQKKEKKPASDMFLWGFLLWLAGYMLGMVFFFVVPPEQIGWYITPIMLPLTIFIAWWRFKGRTLSTKHLVLVGIVWLLMAVILDYFLLVLAFSTENYYDLQIGFYYASMFFIPLIVGMLVRSKGQSQISA